ncbi:MAG: hypothetical protein KKB52_02110, partial [Candidatus Omnitrophica bacterium]|nr:hypothetical protein [Candidatus Omnitrophota bacterium]
MLDWQEKKWVKVIAVTVVIAFLSYDIAWATDFSPISLPDSSTSILSKIKNFVSQKIYNNIKIEEIGDTELLFKSQLVPSKKYEERSGFMRIDTVKQMIKRQMDELQKMRQIEEDRINKAVINYNVNKGMYMDAVEKGQASQSITEQVMKARGDTMSAAAAASEFNYVLNKDGSRVNYKDGLPSSIQNEKIIDAMGNKSIKNTSNMQYDPERLLSSYDSEIIDAHGNVTKVDWYGAEYAPGSIWYAGAATNANKFLLGYREIITDPYGTITTREWSAAMDAYKKDSKKASSYKETMKDALGGIISISTTTDVEYDDDRVKSYHQVSEDTWGNLTTLDWEAIYTKDSLLASVLTKENSASRDGSTSYSENLTTYKYDGDNKLSSAAGQGTFLGEDPYGNINSGTMSQVYEMVNGALKLAKNITRAHYENIDGSIAESES